MAPPNTDAAGYDNEMVSNAKYCVGSGWFYAACYQFRECVAKSCNSTFGSDCICSCEGKPPKLIARTKDCHLFTTEAHADDGSVSIVTPYKVAIRPEIDPKSRQCLTFQGYHQEATYRPCDGGDAQRFYWDKGEGRGYGYIKTKVGMGKGQELCLDVSGGKHSIFTETVLIFTNCKSFSAGLGSASLNQRFYLAP
jgi:hypothetical protein